MALVENLDVFLQDHGVACVKGAGTPFTGIFDTPDSILNMAHVNLLSTEYALKVKTSVIASNAIVTGDTLTVNGIAYQVRDAILVDDGAFTNITLSK